MRRSLPPLVAIFVVIQIVMGFYSSLVATESNSITLLCGTPTPGGTIRAIAVPHQLELTATKSITLTTIYTLINLEPSVNQANHSFLRQSDCSHAGNIYADVLQPHQVKRYSLEQFSDIPDDFAGEIYISSSRVITGVTEIVPKVTAMPTTTPAPTSEGSRVLIPFVTSN